MRIICAISSRNNEILRMERCLRMLGHEVQLFYTDSYQIQCTYLQKKLNELGWKNGEASYIASKKAEFQTLLDGFSPELVFFVNFQRKFFMPQELAVIHRKSKIVFWFVDEVAGHPKVERCLHPYRVFVYEKDDVEYLRKNYAMAAVYCPVGFNDAYEDAAESSDKQIDIAFIGSPFRRRLKLLEALAAEAETHGWRMQIYGPFYETRYFWKKYVFGRKYPLLVNYIQNRSVLPEEAAQIYTHSKICLNIHGNENRSLNPRTFEIMATGSFELLDAHDDYADLVHPGVDLDVFHDEQELVRQVTRYLENHALREKIAKQGKQAVRGKHSMLKGLEKILAAAE